MRRSPGVAHRESQEFESQSRGRIVSPAELPALTPSSFQNLEEAHPPLQEEKNLNAPEMATMSSTNPKRPIDQIPNQNEAVEFGPRCYPELHEVHLDGLVRRDVREEHRRHGLRRLFLRCQPPRRRFFRKQVPSHPGFLYASLVFGTQW